MWRKKRKALLRKTVPYREQRKHSWNRAEIRIVLKRKRFRKNNFDVKQWQTTTTLPFGVSLRRVRQNSFGFKKYFRQRQNVNFLYINTGKESGISLENSLGCERVYTLVSLKKGWCKRVSLRRGAWRLWKVRQNRRRCKNSKACQKK